MRMRYHHKILAAIGLARSLEAKREQVRRGFLFSVMTTSPMIPFATLSAVRLCMKYFDLY